LRDLCYYVHYFKRFSPIFWEKYCQFSWKPMVWYIFWTVFWVKNAINFSAKIFSKSQNRS
jgi:hypothetical protein